MWGLPLFPPKPKHENPARARRTFRRIATWARGAERSNRIPKQAHADRPVVRGEPLFDAGQSEAERVVRSTLTPVAARSQYTPAERAGLFLKAGGEPQ
jgi:hypothetical protein